MPVNPNRAEIQGSARLSHRRRAAGSARHRDHRRPRQFGHRKHRTTRPARREIRHRVLRRVRRDRGRRHRRRRTQCSPPPGATACACSAPTAWELFNHRIGFYGTFSSSLEGGYPPPGRIGIASQSGAYGTHVFVVARERGMGNAVLRRHGQRRRCDCRRRDPLDGRRTRDRRHRRLRRRHPRDGASFTGALEAARLARKPVIVMKVGRSALGQASAKSHTASIAGDDAVTDAVLREFGAIRARSTEEMLDIAQLATRRIYPVGQHTGRHHRQRAAPAC